MHLALKPADATFAQLERLWELSFGYVFVDGRTTKPCGMYDMLQADDFHAGSWWFPQTIQGAHTFYLYLCFGNARQRAIGTLGGQGGRSFHKGMRMMRIFSTRSSKERPDTKAVYSHKGHYFYKNSYLKLF